MRAGRHWLLVLAVATLLALAYGTRQQEEAAALSHAPAQLRTPPAAVPAQSSPRRLSLLHKAWPSRGAGGPGPVPTGRQPSVSWPKGPDAQPRRRYATSAAGPAACEPAAPPRNAGRRRSRPSVAASYPPYPEPHIYLSRPLARSRPGTNINEIETVTMYTLPKTRTAVSTIMWRELLGTAITSRTSIAILRILESVVTFAACVGSSIAMGWMLGYAVDTNSDLYAWFKFILDLTLKGTGGAVTLANCCIVVRDSFIPVFEGSRNHKREDQ